MHTCLRLLNHVAVRVGESMDGGAATLNRTQFTNQVMNDLRALVCFPLRHSATECAPHPVISDDMWEGTCFA